MNDQDQMKAYNQLVAKAWTEPEFRERLRTDPVATLRGVGAEINDGVTIRILEPSETRAYITLPETLPAGEPTDAIEQLTARAVTDPAYKARLVAEPVAVLAEAGLSVPDGMQVEVVEGSDTQGFLVLPPAPEGLDPDSLSDDVAGYFSSAFVPIIAAAVAPAAPTAAGVWAGTSVHTMADPGHARKYNPAFRPSLFVSSGVRR